MSLSKLRQWDAAQKPPAPAPTRATPVVQVRPTPIPGIPALPPAPAKTPVRATPVVQVRPTPIPGIPALPPAPTLTAPTQGMGALRTAERSLASASMQKDSAPAVAGGNPALREAASVAPHGGSASPFTPAVSQATAGTAPATVTSTPGPAPTAALPTPSAQVPDYSSPEHISSTATSVFNGFNSLIQSASAEGQRFLAASMEGFMSALDAMQSQIMGEFQQQMAGVDPATQTALQQLRENAQEYRRTLLDDLNRRGLLQSGVAIESDLRLNKNQLTAEQQVLSQRVGELQNQMTNALMQFSQSRLQALQQYGLTGTQMAQQTGQQRVDAFQSSLGHALNQAQFQQGAQQSNRAFAEGVRQFDQSQGENQRQFDQSQGETQRQFDARMRMSQQEAEQAARQFTQQMGYNWSNLSARQKQDAIDNAFRQNQSAVDNTFRQNEFNSELQQGNSTRETSLALQRVKTYDNREDALTGLRENMTHMIGLGVDINQVYAEIMKLPQKTVSGNLQGLR